MPDRTTILRLHAPAVIPATSRVAIAETAGRRPIIPGRTVPAVSGDRHVRLSGARVLPHHPATGRRRVVVMARCRSYKPAGKLRQASLPQRRSRSGCSSTALEQWSSRRACSPIEADQTLHVRPCQLRLATFTRRECRLNCKPTQGSRSPAHSSSNVRKNHFCSAATHRSRGALWTIFAPPFSTRVSSLGLATNHSQERTRCY